MLDLLSIMWVPFLACLVLVTIHGYLGMHVLSRGIIFVDLALAQFAALGATIAILLEKDPGSVPAYFLSLGFTFVGALVFAFARMRNRAIPQEAFIGVAWAVASSAAILAVSKAPHASEHIEAMLVGSILWVPPGEVAKAAAIYAAVGVFHWVYRRRFLQLSLDAEGAERSGMNVRGWDFLFYATFGIVVTSSVKMAGVLLVFSFLIVPSIFGVLFASSIRARLLAGWTFGWLVSMAGCLVSYGADLPTGATVVCAFGAGLLLAVLLRRLRVAPQASGH